MEEDDNQIKIFLPGEPIALKRPRLGKTKVFDPQKRQKMAAYWDIRSQYNREIIQDPIVMDITFTFGIPKSWSKKKAAEALGKPHIFRPDLDNCIKWVLDVFQDAVIQDDCYVWSIVSKKLYGESPGTTVLIKRASKEALFVN